MTIDEAIKEIKDASDSEVRYGDKEHHYNEVMKRVEAFDLAIKALEQQSRDCKTCKHSDNGNCTGTEECHECMWESKYEQEPCEDCISRKAAINAFERFIHELGIKDEPYNYGEMALSVQNVPSVTPKFTDTEIQKMQELEQAQLEKAYELGKAEIQPSEDYIRELIREFDNKHPALFANYMREFNNHPISEIIEYMWDMHDLIEDIKYRLPNEDEEESEDAE